MFWCLDLSLTIQKSSVDFDSDRSVDIYFPPVSVNGRYACLQMNFTALTYFAVKLAHASTANKYHEQILYRSIESLAGEFRFWEIDITPDMTEGEEFVIVLHAESSFLGTMAVIDSINLQMDECTKTGKMFKYLLI